ncbi:hypothetical protein BDR26DRAFT_1005550 [Obelidium mucronatum]|nr:hypothetical protein BDR26DRAFT_1005550 [Obelidium mucronatum]
MTDFLDLTKQILQSEIDQIAGSIKVTVICAASARAWTGSASNSDILEAAENAGYADKYDEFMQLIQHAVSGSVDVLGRQTECVVQNVGSSGSKRLDLKVFPTGAQDLEFEILSINLTKHSLEHHKVTNAMLQLLIKDRAKMKSKIQTLESAKQIMQRDLNQARQSFNDWSGEKKEQYEMDLFKKFKDVLNSKKRKIRDLMEALETSEKKVQSLSERQQQQAALQEPIKLSPDEPTSPVLQPKAPPTTQGMKRLRSNSPERKRARSTLGAIKEKDGNDDEDEDDDPPPLLIGAKKRK